VQPQPTQESPGKEKLMRCSNRTMKGPLRLLLFVFAVVFALTGCDDDSGNNADHSDGPPARTAFLTMDIQDAENGFTDPAPGKYDIREGTPFAISATPDTGFMFSHWETSENGTVANPENAETTVTLTGDATITPHFNTKAFITIEVSPAGRGYTRPMTGKPLAIAKGDTLDLTADPAPGYHFRRWRFDGGADIAEPENMQTSALFPPIASSPQNLRKLSSSSTASSIPALTPSTLPHPATPKPWPASSGRKR